VHSSAALTFVRHRIEMCFPRWPARRLRDHRSRLGSNEMTTTAATAARSPARRTDALLSAPAQSRFAGSAQSKPNEKK
jgi:hypothetical protein